MIVYKVGRYTFSADLCRYSKEVGQEGNYTLGFCTVEYLPKGNSLYHPEPKIIDANKPYDIIEFDPKAKINGSLAIQCEPDTYNATQAEEISWIAIKIDAPNGDLDGLIRKVAEERGIELTERVMDQTRERLFTKYATPQYSDPATVGALVRNTSTLKADYYYKSRIDALAKHFNTTARQAEWLVFLDRGSKMAKRDDGWHPTLLDLDEPATEKELNELVDAGAIAFDAESNTYTNTEKTTLALRENYL
ncbi:TPA: hypothetical protein NJ742_004066 [Vibrio parahaemolyticus]|nr:hypothetical protein [Vibrio parahaemolyticus]